jgi:hypothetical protein
MVLVGSSYIMLPHVSSHSLGNPVKTGELALS